MGAGARVSKFFNKEPKSPEKKKKKKTFFFQGGGGGVGGARVSDFFYKESKSKRKKMRRGGEKRGEEKGARASEFLLLRIKI